MKRSLIVLCAAALLATLPLARVAVAAKPAMVEICHVKDIIDLEYGLGIGVGRVIELPENALAAHEAHGDSTDFLYIDENWRWFFDFIFGVTLPDGEAFVVYEY